MKEIIKLFKNNWADPVWSKVFAGIILAILSGLGLLFISIIKQIPIKDLYNESLTTYVRFNYFSIIIMILVFLALLIPAILLNIVQFQLKNLKFPKKLRTEKFDLQNFLDGDWHLTYVNKKTNDKGEESIMFIDGNQYLISNKLTFVLTDIEFDENEKEVKWSKTRYTNRQKHSREALKIVGNNSMIGDDDSGFKLSYNRK